MNKTSSNTQGTEKQQCPVQPKVKAQDPWAHQAKIPGVNYVIAVASGKGGVGKSTVAVNIAAALSIIDKRVGVLDLDVYGPSLPMMVGIHKPPNVLNGKIQPIEKYGMYFLSFGMFMSENAPVIWRGPLVAKLVNQFFDDTEWENLDYLIIDLPPGTGDVQLSMVQRIKMSGAIMVTTPQDLALLDIQKGADMFKKVNVPVLGIVENMSSLRCPHCGKEIEVFKGRGGELESKRLGVPLLGAIPLDPDLTITSDSGMPEVLTHKESSITKIFLEVAREIDKLLSK
ncbi:MAG: Mrp/NBP35 family ATP-binding protein [Candidatus Marinimicrobia bacterium]|nr:Mrp/NBP35 family ATP-binding protein [Candidatus Neomarinimicrobiota bacterium]